MEQGRGQHMALSVRVYLSSKACMTDRATRSTPANTAVSTFAQEGHTLVAVSDKAEFLVMNTKTGTVGRQIPCPPQVVNLHVSHSSVLSGSSDGILRTHDLRGSTKRSSGTELSVRAHQGSIQAIESSGNWVYTIGWTLRCVLSFLS